MDRGAWQATVHGVTKSQTRLSNYITTNLIEQLSPPDGTNDLTWLMFTRLSCHRTELDLCFHGPHG